jgi:multiple sugar transport system ATP-binding protein
LGVRPEDLQPATEGFGIDVAVVEPLGAHTLVTAFVGEPRQVFRAALDSSLTYQAGQRLQLTPTLDRVRWYDSAGQMIAHTHGD